LADWHNSSTEHALVLWQGSVADLIKKIGPLTETLTRHYTRQVLQGLHYLHEKNIIHRDIKGVSHFTQVDDSQSGS